MWVRSEYAGELAVLSAWLCALLPWSVSYASQEGLQLFRIHFPYLFFQFVPGVDLGEFATPYVFVWDAPSFPEDATLAFGYQLWIVASVVITLALALSIVYYVFDERLEDSSPVDPVRVMGGLLSVSAVGFSVSTYFLWSRFIGITVPVGVVFMYLLGGTLLVVERT